MLKDVECKAYVHTYKCNEKSCDDCKNRYGRRRKVMTGRELNNKLNYIGMERSVRRRTTQTLKSAIPYGSAQKVCQKTFKTQ